MASETPVWFITGCSTGFGRELARAVLANGWNAVVTARDVATLAEFSQAGSALLLALDVTDGAAITNAVDATMAQFGTIDVLVNNAGYGYLAAVEEGDDDEIRRMFDANVFGLAAMTRAVLPVMRRQRSGHIVNISSMGGHAGFAGVGYYNATKFAVEGLSEALAAETAPLGIKVTSVAPGPFRTDWGGRSLKTPTHPIADYRETAGVRIGQIQDYSGAQPGDPARAAQAIIKAVQSAEPPVHLLLGAPALDIVTKKLRRLQDEISAWRELSLSADFPK